MNEIMTHGQAIYIDTNDNAAALRLGQELALLLPVELKGNAVVLCIGTDRATGDSLGPLTGYLLMDMLGKKSEVAKVYGTLEQPVHAKNLIQTIDMIYETLPKPFIIAIDACLGRNVGYITIGRGAVCPGEALGKPLPCVGDVFVTGVVNYAGGMDLRTLQTTRLNTVMKMARIIANGLFLQLKPDK